MCMRSFSLNHKKIFLEKNYYLAGSMKKYMESVIIPFKYAHHRLLPIFEWFRTISITMKIELNTDCLVFISCGFFIQLSRIEQVLHLAYASILPFDWPSLSKSVKMDRTKIEWLSTTSGVDRYGSTYWSSLLTWSSTWVGVHSALHCHANPMGGAGQGGGGRGPGGTWTAPE